MSTMSYRFVAGVHLAAHDQRGPSDAEWQAYFEDIERHVPEMLGLLICANGAGPSLKQRGYANHFWETHPRRPIAVLTDSKLVRGAVLAFSWVMGQQIRAFATSDLLGAFAFLGVGQGHQEIVQRELITLLVERAPAIAARFPAATAPTP
jgi:hypothetical protein